MRRTLLKSHWVLVVVDQFTRRIIGFGVQAIAVDGPGLCRMFNQAISGHGLPTRISTDHDPLFQFHRWQANLRITMLTVVSIQAGKLLTPTIIRDMFEAVRCYD
jgi:transposase InsO family protein